MKIFFLFMKYIFVQFIASKEVAAKGIYVDFHPEFGIQCLVFVM